MKETQPFSKEDLITDFQSIGITNGMNLMIHSSLSKIGWVIGGAQTVVSALIETVGENGTIVMPAATPNCLHPSHWEKVEVPKNWIPKIVEHLPVFDKAVTPTTMGAIPETFRNWPQTLRSNHPINSVCARGSLAQGITALHSLEMSEGENTPYEKVYALDFNILLIGVRFNRCTMLHFAESKSNNKRITTSIYPVFERDKKVWIEVRDMGNDNSTHFPEIEELYSRKGELRQGKIGEADSMLVSARKIVDFATNYFNNVTCLASGHRI